MKNLLSKKAFVAFAAGTMLLSSCHDNDIYDPRDIVKDYADNWQKTFGDIDPEQDWNVATSVTANAALDIPGSSTMKIYTNYPLSSGSRLLAVTDLNNGVGSISFDAIKGSSSVFVAIYQDNQYIIFDNYPVENGQVNIKTNGAAKIATRAAETWTNNHLCDWENKFNFPKTSSELPTGAIDLTNLGSYNDQNGNNTNAVYYVPSGYTGSLSLNGKIKFKEGMLIYNYGTITGIDANWENVLTIYNVGSWNWTVQSGGRHTIINTGIFTLTNDANVGILYNGGHLEITDTDISNSVTINSIGTASINMPNGGDFKAAADIHGTLTSAKDLKIQNSNTQYICGINVRGTLDLTQGKLESSYIEADHIKFDGDQLWLLPGGHVKANSINVPNGGCYIYGEKNSNGLIEVGDITFANDNDLNRTFSDNIYFKISGFIDCSGATNLPGGDSSKKKYNTAAEYIAQIGGPAARVNGGNVTGTPECGMPWSTEYPTPSEVEINDKGNSWIIACEDLGSKDDIDFNDVVFSVKYVTGQTTATVTPLAAGGIYSAEIGYTGDPSFIYEIHEWFNRPGENGSQKMLNTGVDSSADEDNVKAKSKTVTVPQNFKLSYNAANQTNMGGFYIRVSSTTKATTILGSGVGEAPQMILVPGDWKWPKERKKIYDAYPDFEAWSKNSKKSDWYDNPTTNSSLLYTSSLTDDEIEDDDNSSSGGDASDSEYGVSLAEYISVSRTKISADVFKPYRETGAEITIIVKEDGYSKCVGSHIVQDWVNYFANYYMQPGSINTFKLTKDDIANIINETGMYVNFFEEEAVNGTSGFYIKATN